MNKPKGRDNMFEAVLKEIENHQRIIIHRHLNPDGDAIGSQVGLKHLILENFPHKEVYMVGDPAGRYSFMDDSIMDEIPDEAYPDALAFVLDLSAHHLAADKRYQTAHKTIRLDHHISGPEKFCDIEIADPTYESACGLVTAMALELNWEINRIAARSLFTGMVTDSGRFRYDCTTARTFRLAAALSRQDLDTNEIYRNLYTSSLEEVKIRSQFINRIQQTEHHVAYLYNDLELIRTLPMDTFGISRGMVSVMADLRGIDIWVNFTETPENNILCELRSAKYNINPIAVKYGGGGHEKASGATLHSRGEAMAMLSDLDAMMIGEYSNAERNHGKNPL